MHQEVRPKKCGFKHNPLLSELPVPYPKIRPISEPVEEPLDAINATVKFRTLDQPRLEFGLSRLMPLPL
jgi:hypothetical protein